MSEGRHDKFDVEGARAMSMLNYEYFKLRLPELMKEHRGQFVVIKDQQIVKFFDTFHEAFVEMSQKEARGTFIIQLCMPEDEVNMASYVSKNMEFHGVGGLNVSLDGYR